MLTYTPLDLVLPNAGGVLRLISLCLLLGLLWLGWRWARWAWRGTTWISRLLRGAPLLALLGNIAYGAIQDAIATADFKRRQGESLAIYEAHCKQAGLHIHKTVEDVQGIVLMKWRPNFGSESLQFDPGDMVSHFCSGEECIVNLLTPTQGLELDPHRKAVSNAGVHAYGGYQFVESIDPRSGRMFRYRLQLYRPKERDPKWGEWVVERELVKTPITHYSVRYGITWDEISTQDDRSHWVAGSALRIIDLNTNEAIADRITYIVDLGLGNRNGNRSPWTEANRHACPRDARVPEEIGRAHV